MRCQPFKIEFHGESRNDSWRNGRCSKWHCRRFDGKNVDPFEAAVAGAFVNGAAGDFVANEIGFHMVATDIIDWIPHVFVDPMSHLKVRKPSGR